MVNDPLFESERNIEARQSKIFGIPRPKPKTRPIPILEPKTRPITKKKRSITGISKIDNKLRIGLSKIKSPGFFKRGQKGNIDEAVSPVVDVRKGNIQILKEAGLAAFPLGRVGKVVTKGKALFPSNKSIQSFIRSKVVKGEKIDPNVATAIIIKDPKAFQKFQTTFKPSAQQIKTTQGTALKLFKEKAPSKTIPDSSIAFNVIGKSARPMISRDIGEEALTTVAPGRTGIAFGTRVTASPRTPLASKVGVAGVGTGVAGVVAAPIIPKAKTTDLPKTRPMISVDTMEEDLNIPNITIPEPSIPEINIPEPSIPDITIPEINTPNITTPQIASDPFEEVGGGYGKSTDVDTTLTTEIASDPFEEVGGGYGKSTDVDTEKTTDFDLENRPLIDPITKEEKKPFDLSDFYNPSKETPTGSTRKDLTRKTLSLYDYGFDRNKFPGRASDPFEEVGGGYGGSGTEPTKDPEKKPEKKPEAPFGVTNIARKRKRRFRLKKSSGSKSDFDKRKSAALPYPSKVQYKEKDKYVTFNLNTNKKKVFNTPQGIGVNPGSTPEDTLKVIQKQKTKPKFKKYKLGNLVLSVTSPETIVIRRLRAFRNNKTNKRFRR